MAVVSAKNVPFYDKELIYRAVAELFELTDTGFSRGAKVLLKPNFLTARKPELGVTTNPLVAEAVVRRLKEMGAGEIVVADSPGGPYLHSRVKAVYSAAGYLVPGLEEFMNYDLSYRSVPSAAECGVPEFNIISPVLDADLVINLPKLKTHSMTTVSAGVKNLFGVIPGLQKTDMHRRLPDAAAFCRMLCALAATVKPGLTLIDAVDSMEGNGPGSGTVKHTGLLMASKDVFALDVAAVRFMGISEAAAPHLVEARKLGLLPEDVEMNGDGTEACQPPFVLPDSILKTNFMDSVPSPARGIAGKIMDRFLRSYPKVDKNLCIGCGRCAESCPQHIIKVRNRKASMSRHGCISCFCCQEMCPAHAISAKRIIDK